MDLTTIVGHGDQLAALKNDRVSDNVSHAYLFAGPKHLGKFTVARWFAQELLAEGRTEDDAGRLHDQVERLIHPDYLQISELWIEGQNEDLDRIARSTNIPQKHRKDAGAKRDEISIEDVRAIQERLMGVGTGKYRCCLIRSVERMTLPAASAFLKILEEPPQGVVFLLTSEFPSSLLPTLVSRTRFVRFFRLSNEELSPLVKGLASDDATFLLRLAEGAPGLVARLRADPEKLRTERLTAGKATEFWRTTKTTERLQFLKVLHDRGSEAEVFLKHLALALREEPPEKIARLAPHLQTLARDLETNAQRRILTQRFALSVG